VKSIYYWWYACKRLDALNIDITKDGGENYVFLAQRDMMELEIEWYRDESIQFLIILAGVTATALLIGYHYQDSIYTFVSDMVPSMYQSFLIKLESLWG